MRANDVYFLQNHGNRKKKFDLSVIITREEQQENNGSKNSTRKNVLTSRFH